MSITTSPTIDKIAPALAKVQGEMKAAGKSGDNTFDRYRYAKLEDYLAVARPLLHAHGLSVVVSVLDVHRLQDRATSKGGTERAVEVLIQARLVHDSGEWIQVLGVGEGQDRADKAAYKALTGGKKYLLAGLLAIPTTDDPESDEAVGTAPAPVASGRQPSRVVKGPIPEFPPVNSGVMVTMSTPVPAPAPLTNKQRYESAMEHLDMLLGTKEASELLAQLKVANGGATTVPQKQKVLEALEHEVSNALASRNKDK